MNTSRLYILFAVIVIGCALGGLAQTATNAMMTAIGTELGTNVALGQLITTVFMLVSGVCMPVAAYLTKRFSLRALFVASWLFLFAGSVIIFLAPSFELLLVGRVLQAISVGISMPLSQTLSIACFPGKESIAMGIAGIAIGFAPNIGPTIGGFFAGTVGWRFFFLMLAVLAIVLIAVSIFIADADKPAYEQQRLDMASVLLSTIGFGGLLLGFSFASDAGFGDIRTIVCLIIGVIGVIAFLLRQRRHAHPLLSLDVFRNAHYRNSFIATACLFTSFMGIILVLPLYWQNLRGGTALEAGMLLLPAAIVALIANPVAGILSNRLGYYKVIIPASICLIVGAASFLATTEETPFAVLIVMQAVRAAGISSLVGPLVSWGMSKLDHSLIADGSSFSTLIRQVCASIGTALMVLGMSIGQALGNALLGYHIAFAFSTVMAVGVLVFALVQFAADRR